jgi:hypothetical protein
MDNVPSRACPALISVSGRLVATASEGRLNFRRKPAHVVCGSQRLLNNRDL